MDKQQKKQIKRYISWGCAAALVILLAVMPMLAGRQAQSDGPTASILTDTVQTRDITTQVIGGGQLSGSSTEAVTIPAQIKLTKYLVSNGDSVSAGDPIARVDKVSVMTALEEVQDTLDYLAEQIADVSSDTESDKVVAEAGGLVKVIYGQEGDSVRDVMLEHGALAVLSLDGRMAVDIQRNTDLSHGDTVCVTLSDGSEVEGRVESAIGGELTVSVEDEDYPIGETVTVRTEDGTRLGSGQLYIHNPWNASAYYGTIAAVTVQEGSTVTAGKRLFRLETSGHTAEFQILVSQRQEYEALMQELFAMYSSGVISAPCDGLVTGVDTDGSYLLAADSQQGWFVQLLSDESTGESEGGSGEGESGESEGGSGEGESGEGESGEGGSGEGESGEGGNTAAYSVLVGQVIAEGVMKVYPESILCSDLSEVQVNTAWMTGYASYSGTVYEMDMTTEHSQAIQTGDVLFKVTDSSGTKLVYHSNQPLSGGDQQGQGGSDQLPGGMDDFSGMTGGISGFGGGSYAQEVFTPYSLDTLTIASLTTQEQMRLEITVDEQDISSFRTGMETSVTVEALPGQSFPAIVTSIGNTGTNSGGSSKFTVTVTLQKSGDMLPGMNASAYLDLETAESVLTVPAAALTSQGARTVIYTDYDAKNECLTDPVEVTTGLSDGEYVQILSGLEEGAEICYAYYDTLEISNTAENRFGF